MLWTEKASLSLAHSAPDFTLLPNEKPNSTHLIGNLLQVVLPF